MGFMLVHTLSDGQNAMLLQQRCSQGESHQLGDGIHFLGRTEGSLSCMEMLTVMSPSVLEFDLPSCIRDSPHPTPRLLSAGPFFLSGHSCLFPQLLNSKAESQL